MDELEQFGITLLKIAFDDIFNTGNVVITSLHDFMKNFSKDDIDKVPNENFLDLTQHMNSVGDRLSESKAFPRKTLVHFLAVLTQCSVSEFVGPFELILNTERARYMKSDGTSVNNKRTLERVLNITVMAKHIFAILMCPIPVTLPEYIRSYWGLTTIVIQKITSRQRVLYLVTRRRIIRQRRHVQPLV